VIRSIKISFSFGFDCAIKRVNAVRLLLSIICFPFK